MAVMYPPTISRCEGFTEGERQVYEFLKISARPHRDFICWFKPEIVGREPDFILYCKRHGLIVIEVKDWVLDQITGADPDFVTFHISGQRVEKINPLRQAKGYVNSLMNFLENNQSLLSEDPAHYGKLKIPINRMVIFPNIEKEEFGKRRLDGPIPITNVLFKGDLEPTSEINRDTSGQKFNERVCGTALFPFEGLREIEVNKLKALLWPEIRIDLPKRKGLSKEKFQAEIRSLDEAQARLALTLKPGHQIIKGPPGSGKTFVLVNRCCYLHRFCPDKRILVVCFNIALQSYLKRLIQEKGIGVASGRVEVRHIFELCSQIINQSVEFEKQGTSYYDSVIELTLETVIKGGHPIDLFDLILVDEGQDFSGDMFKILLGLLKPGGDFVIALDDSQDLYRREMSWKSFGIEVQGRSRSLKRVYRNTAEIYEFARGFIGERPTEIAPSLFPDRMELHGEPPQMLRFKTVEEEENFLVDDIKRMIASQEYKKSEIAIIYDDKVYDPISFGYASREFPFRMLSRFESEGILTKWVSQDLRTKEMFDITTDRVSLISVHSAKGLDFDLVYLVGAGRIQPKDDTRDHLVRLLYVAITRAKHRLVIPYVEESEFIIRMKSCLENP